MPVEITFVTTTLFALGFLVSFYSIVCLISKKLIVPSFSTLFLYVTIFSLFGIIGEVFVNTLYERILGAPLWEYRLFPAHDGNISYYFIFIWGSLGFYKYFSDHYFIKRKISEVSAGLVMGTEAVFLELVYNGLFLLIFDKYIFYYLPANLGPLSHLSCLQVIPFYFIVGLIVTKLITQQKKVRPSKSLLAFYWMIIITFVFMV